MKVIDLLNKIANEEEVPKKIRVLGNEFEYDNNDFKYRSTEYGKDDLFEHIGFYKGIVLNGEVEIIEDTPKEDKKIDRVSLLDVNTDYKLKDILNEIIDKINGGENERNK